MILYNKKNIGFSSMPSRSVFADRYWSPAGSSNWDDANVWATTEGGDPTGIATPTTSDAVYFTSTNNNDCNVGATAYSLSLSFNSGTGKYTGTFSGSSQVHIYGSVLLSSDMTLTHTGALACYGIGTHTINFDTKTRAATLSFYGIGDYTFTGTITTGSGNTGSIYLNNGILDTNEQTVNCSDFVVNSGADGLDITNSTINIGDDWNYQSATVPTTTGSTIVMLAHISNLTGNGHTYNNIQLGGVSDILDSNTFNNILLDAGSTLRCTAGITTTLTTLDATGAGTTITSETAATHTFSCSAGPITVENCTISYSIAQGGADWVALTDDGNVDGGNNTGWDFGDSSSNMFLLF